MARKINNADLVAGRLNKTPGTAGQPPSDEQQAQATGYRSNRLGILREQESAPAHAPWEQPAESAPPPHADADIAPVPAVAAVHAGEGHRESWEQQFSGVSLNRPGLLDAGRKRIAIAGGAGVALLVLVVVLVKLFSPSSAPQAAVAAPSPAVISQTVAVVPSPGTAVPSPAKTQVTVPSPIAAVQAPTLPAKQQAATVEPDLPPALKGDWGDVPGQAAGSSSTPNKPQQPSVRYVTCPAGLRLRGVVQQPSGGRLANINGRFLGVGDHIGGATVVSITDFSAEMEINGDRFLVAFASELPPAEEGDLDSDDDHPKAKAGKKPPTKRKAVADEDDAEPADESKSSAAE